MGRHAGQVAGQDHAPAGRADRKAVPELAALETEDTGLPIHQTGHALIPRAADNFYFFSEVATRMDGRCYPVDDQMLNYTLVQPVGVCGLISPWNVPFMTATWKTAPCLALGNTAVLKMSELSPLTADWLGRAALEAGVPKGGAQHRPWLWPHGGRGAGSGIRTCAPSPSPAARPRDRTSPPRRGSRS